MSTAVITGTSTGIGFATAVSLARAGHRIYATMRDPDRSGDLRSLAAREGLRIEVRRLDVDEDTSVRDAVTGILQEAGGIDVLVNNAGIGGSGSVEELPIAEFRRCMETNFFGAIRCIQAVVPSMRDRGHGCIINVSSVAGRISLAPQACYSASKFALEALSEALAQEVKPFGIRVVIVEPGVVATPIFGKTGPPKDDSRYPHARRLRAVYAALLERPVSPFVVGDAIRDIVEGDSWQLRYPVGPDAVAHLRWRASFTDEQWVEYGAQSDDAWLAYVKETFDADIASKFPLAP